MVHCTNHRISITVCIVLGWRQEDLQISFRLVKDFWLTLQTICKPEINNAVITTPEALIFKTNNFSFFSGTLAENNRLRLVHNVVVAFGKLMSAARGEVLCSITTAKVCKSHYCNYYYSTITPFYHIKSREHAKYDPLFLCYWYNFGMMKDVYVFKKLEGKIRQNDIHV